MPITDPVQRHGPEEGRPPKSTTALCMQEEELPYLNAQYLSHSRAGTNSFPKLGGGLRKKPQFPPLTWHLVRHAGPTSPSNRPRPVRGPHLSLFLLAAKSLQAPFYRDLAASRPDAGHDTLNQRLRQNAKPN